jgi:hypothetical protein
LKFLNLGSARLRRFRRSALTLVVAIGTLLTAGLGAAQSALDFDKWMQDIDKKSQSVLRNISKKDVFAAADDAKEIARLYQLMEDFYQRKGDSDDAVMASYDGRYLANNVLQAVTANDFDKAFAAAVGIARDCRECHVRYKPL